MMATPIPELDARYDRIVAERPQGLTPEEFRRIALESADEDGRIYPHPIEWWAGMSLLMGMAIKGLVTRKCRRNEAGPWYITDEGRKYLRRTSTTKASDG
jgi:hypothetical protein